MKIESKFHVFKNEIKTSHIDSDDENNHMNSESYKVSESLIHLRFGTDLNVDHLNNRLLTCKAMHGFANSCESKTRFLVPIFFRFMK